MAEVISIKIEYSGLTGQAVVQDLVDISKTIDQINKKTVKPKIDVSQIQELNKAQAETVKLIAKEAKAQAELLRAKASVKRADADLIRSKNQLALADKQLALETRRQETEEKKRKTAIKQTELAMKQAEATAEKVTLAEKNRKLVIDKGNAALKQKQLQEEKTRTAVEQHATADARFATQQEKTRTEVARYANEQERTKQAIERTTQAEIRASTTRESAAQATASLSTSLAGMVTQVFSLHMVLSKVVSTFREALQTMKEVDSALVTIQKTTGFTGEQLDRVTASAYDLANAYGRTATEILNAASVYARAGFKDNLEQMTELSALLQNVGDLESEVASKFLIATNAAWKLGGSYESLMSIIDGLNAQTNQAAVDMEGLTSGITVAGSVFAAAGESVQTFAGMLGTGIALTARSGSEVGRGLRTIAMNIRQIKGELDDGEIIDDESISDAAKALHSIGISVADANGELRLTSDVLDELAGKWNELTTAEQSYISQSLAGKRQANILVSLMQNWDEAQRQMALYANGAGSALQENEIYMDSWEAKSKQLSAAWTRFVSDLVDTDLIKGALDALIKLVNMLDTGIGRLLITSGGIATAVITIIGLVSKLGSAITALNAVVAVNPIFLAIAGTTAGLYMLIQAFDSIETKTEKLARAAEEAASAYEDIQSEVQKLEENEENLTKLEKEKLDLLREQAEIKRQQAEAAAKEKALYDYNSKYSGSLEESGYSGSYNAFQRKLETATREEANAVLERMRDIEARASSEGATQRANSLINQHGGLLADMNAAKTAEDFKRLEQQADSTYEAIVDMAVELAEFAEILGDEVPPNLVLALNKLNAYIGGLRTAKAETEDAGDTTVEVVDELRVKLKRLSDEADAADTAIAGVTSAVENFGDGSVELYDAMRLLESTIPGSTDKLYDFETASLKIEAAQIADKESLLDFIQTSKTMDLSDQIRQLEDAAAASWNYAFAIAASVPGADARTLATQMTDPLWGRIGALKEEMQSINAWVDTLRGRSSYHGGSGSGGSGSSSSSTQADEELAKRKEAVALLKSELEFLKAKGASEAEIVAKQKEIQNALHNQAEYMREIEASQTDIYALSTEWWKIQNEITKDDEDELQQHKDRVSLLKSELSLLEAQGASNDEIVAKQRQIQDALKAQENYMRSIGASQTEINALVTEWYEIENKILKIQQELFETVKRTIDEYYDAAVDDKKKELEYEEKILAVQKAQIALQNAQNERNVRYFNAASGQWEWGANAKNVQSAKEALSKAQEALIDYQEQAAWAEFKAAWEYIAEQIKSGAVTFAEAYDYMERKMKELQNKYNVNMSGVLNDSVGKFKGLNKTVKDLDEKTARELGAAVGTITNANKTAASELGKANEELAQQNKNLGEAAKLAVEEFQNAFELVSAKIESGEMTFDEAYEYLKEQAGIIADKYGVDMTDALDMAIAQMDEIYSGLDGISKAVRDGALTPKEAFDIISKALNEVSTQYGKDITGEVNKILKQKGGFNDGLQGLADAVANGEITFDDAWALLQDAIDETSDLYGIDLQGELDTAIQNMGKSADALDQLWKTIVMNKMRMNSVSWLELDEQEKKAKASGDTNLVKQIQEQKAALHAENEALGNTIGATYDQSGYWSLNGQRLYDPVADKASGEFSGGGGGGGGGSRSTNKNQDLIDAFEKHANSGQDKYFIPGLGVVNMGSASADLFKMEAGMKGNDITRWYIINSGMFTPEEATEYLNNGGIVTKAMADKFNSQPDTYLYDFPLAMQDSSVQQMLANSGFNANGEYEGYAKVYGGGAGNTMVKINNGQISVSGLEEMGSNMLVTADGSILRVDGNGHVYETGEKWENSGGSWDSTKKLIVKQLLFDEQNKMVESGNYSSKEVYGKAGLYDSGGVLHGIGGIKATARDEMVLPPDITERLLTPINNGFVRGKMDDLRSMLGMQTEFGSVDNTRIGTQNNGDIYTMNGVTISEGQARVTTVYDLAQMARNLGAYKRS